MDWEVYTTYGIIDATTGVKGGLVHFFLAFKKNAFSLAALQQGAPGQMTWLEDPPSWLKPWLGPA